MQRTTTTRCIRRRPMRTKSRRSKSRRPRSGSPPSVAGCSFFSPWPFWRGSRANQAAGNQRPPRARAWPRQLRRRLLPRLPLRRPRRFLRRPPRRLQLRQRFSRRLPPPPVRPARRTSRSQPNSRTTVLLGWHSSFPARAWRGQPPRWRGDARRLSAVSHDRAAFVTVNSAALPPRLRARISAKGGRRRWENREEKRGRRREFALAARGPSMAKAMSG